MVPPLAGGLLAFLQVGLHFDEMCLEFSPGIFLLQLGSPGLAVFLELPRFRGKAVGDEDDLPLCDGLTRHGCVIDALIHPRVEAFKWLIAIEGLLEFPVVL